MATEISEVSGDPGCCTGRGEFEMRNRRPDAATLKERRAEGSDGHGDAVAAIGFWAASCLFLTTRMVFPESDASVTLPPGGVLGPHHGSPSPPGPPAQRQDDVVDGRSLRMAGTYVGSHGHPMHSAPPGAVGPLAWLMVGAAGARPWLDIVA